MADTKSTRFEHDTMGEIAVPAEALFGAQTARAAANFQISGWRLPCTFIAALARIKGAFARANGALGLVDPPLASAIAGAADRVAAGDLDSHFPVDVFQTGSGTSSNMNVNEVIAHLANLSLGGDPAEQYPVHPNDHVNRGQSSNDVVPSALRLSTLENWRTSVRPVLDDLAEVLGELAVRHRETVTLGRTHLMDAMPTTYGRIFAGWRARVVTAAARGDTAASELRCLPLGGTAVGTGVNADPRAVRHALELLAEVYGSDLRLVEPPEAGIAAQDDVIAVADASAGVSRVLLAVCNDLRLRGSGPFGGLGELRLPVVQPGSSIMPGKVNPVIPEAVSQVAIEVEGLAAACRGTAVLHQLELSHANPMLAWNMDVIAHLLANAMRSLVDRCLRGVEVDEERCRANAEASPALATALATRLGYERAAEVAKEAELRGEPVAVTARRLKVLPDDEIVALLDVRRLAGVGR